MCVCDNSLSNYIIKFYLVQIDHPNQVFYCLAAEAHVPKHVFLLYSTMDSFTDVTYPYYCD